MNTLKAYCLTGLICASAGAGWGAEGPVGSVLRRYVDAKRIAGVVSILSDRDYNMTIDCAGWADREAQRPMSTNTVCAIFSMTKTFTGTAIVCAIDEGKISLDDEVARYLPEFANVRKKDGAKLSRPILLRDLMTHMSGSAKSYGVVNRDKPLREVARQMASEPFEDDPGIAFRYNNSGIDTAAACLEKAVGEPYEVYLKRKVLEPLGMTDTTFWPNAEQLTRLARAYTSDDKALRRGTDSCMPQLVFPKAKKVFACASAGLFSTPSDIARFSQMLAHRGEWKGVRIISRRTFDDVFSVKQTPGGLANPYTVGSWIYGDWFGHEGALRTDQRANLRTGHSRVFMIQTENKAGSAFFDLKRDWHAAADGVQGTPATPFDSLNGYSRLAPRPLKVLTIGNSFSKSVLVDLPHVAKALGCDLEIGSLYIGGCSLERHWQNYVAATNRGAAPYAFDYYAHGEKKDAPAKISLTDAVKFADWDIVTFQQASVQSWDAKSYAPYLADLTKAVWDILPRAEPVLHETWSYSADCTRFKKLNLDSRTMYAKLHNAYYSNAGAHGWRVIPTGTAVQLWRARQQGEDVVGLSREDRTHLNRRGQYLQALVWAGKLFGVDVSACAYAPKELSEREAARLRATAAATLRGEAVPPEWGGLRADEERIARIRKAGVFSGDIVEINRFNGYVRVGIVLRPTTNSYIRCELGLPDDWKGTLWGHGNGGWAGWTTCYSDSHMAHIHTDLGTSRYKIGTYPIDLDVRRDFGWRATHLMTVAAKRLIRAYYGKDVQRAYFSGWSTGGGQALCEAQLYPMDYDGIIAGIPAFDRTSLATPGWQRARARARFGGAWFSAAEEKAMRQAELDYFAKSDPEVARGHFIWDPEPTPEKLNGCWRAIVAAQPALANREALWRSLFEPVTACGVRLAPGQLLGCELRGACDFLGGKIIGPKSVSEWTEEDMLRFAHDTEHNFTDTDYALFRAHGGKIIMFAGLEDVSVPERPVTEYYEKVMAREGGYANTSRYFRYYRIPGRWHAAAGCDFLGSVGEPRDLSAKLVAWVEKNVAPEELEVPFNAKMKGDGIRVSPHGRP